MEPVKTLLEFVGEVDRKFGSWKDNPNIYYRGLEDCQYELLSPIGRYWKSFYSHELHRIDQYKIKSLEGLNDIFKNHLEKIEDLDSARDDMISNIKDHFFEKEKQIYNDFKHYASSDLINLGIDQSNKWDVLALSRHHGLETRLMDWTTNPLIALYFSALNKFETDGAVYIVAGETASYSHELRPKNPFNPGNIESIFYIPAQLSDRIRNQDSVLLVQRDPTKPYSPDNLCKITIKGDKKIDIIKDLDRYGINAKTLFSGLDGIATNINTKHYLEWKKIKAKYEKEKN